MMPRPIDYSRSNLELFLGRTIADPEASVEDDRLSEGRMDSLRLSTETSGWHRVIDILMRDIQTLNTWEGRDESDLSLIKGVIDTAADSRSQVVDTNVKIFLN